jgi:hypothetical protein
MKRDEHPFGKSPLPINEYPSDGKWGKMRHDQCDRIIRHKKGRRKNPSSRATSMIQNNN